MNDVPDDLKYAKSHEWARLEADGTVTVGITDHAQELLGDMVYVELPETGHKLTAGKECAVVESVKAASDVYAPITGEVVAVNEAVTTGPDAINKEPYGAGWLFRLEPADPQELQQLLDAPAYARIVAEEV